MQSERERLALWELCAGYCYWTSEEKVGSNEKVGRLDREARARSRKPYMLC